VIEIDKRVRGPQILANQVPRDDLAGALEKHDQQIERLRLQSDFVARAAQLT
jgi:hypothetical protein